MKHRKLIELGIAGSAFGLIMFAMPNYLLLWLLCVPGAIVLWITCLVFSWWAIDEVNEWVSDD